MSWGKPVCTSVAVSRCCEPLRLRPGALQAALAAAKDAQAAGSFAEAVAAYEVAKRLHVESGDDPGLIECLLERATCSVEVGSLQQVSLSIK